MAKKEYSHLQLFVQKIAASQAGSKLFSGFLHHLDRSCLRASKGKTSLTEIFTGIPMILLTTTGAKSGLPRTLPVLCYRDDKMDGTVAVVAANWGREKLPAWYYNMKAHPRVSGLIDGRQRTYMAREAAGDEYEHFWQIAESTFSGLPQYKQRVGQRAIPIMVLNPDASE